MLWRGLSVPCSLPSTAFLSFVLFSIMLTRKIDSGTTYYEGQAAQRHRKKTNIAAKTYLNHKHIYKLQLDKVKTEVLTNRTQKLVSFIWQWKFNTFRGLFYIKALTSGGYGSSCHNPGPRRLRQNSSGCSISYVARLYEQRCKTLSQERTRNLRYGGLWPSVRTGK